MTESAAPQALSIRDKNKLRIRSRIVEAAMTLVARRGLDGVSPDDIAATAEVGRATFFRYFDSKEAAVVVGFYEKRLEALVDRLRAAPAELGPMEAVIHAYRQLDISWKQQADWIRMQADLGSESPSLKAKAMSYQAQYEAAIAEAISVRYRRLAAKDPRPRLLAASSLAVVRTCIDHWSATGAKGNLPKLVREGLRQLSAGFSEHDGP
jgi:AcrR family transcriptional regulator